MEGGRTDESTRALDDLPVRRDCRLRDDISLEMMTTEGKLEREISRAS